MTRPRSEDTDSSHSTCESDSDAGSCSDRDHSSRSAYVLPENHRFQSIRPELALFILRSLTHWMKVIQRGSPPEVTLPPRKRLREEDEDIGDRSVMMDSPARHPPLACPFYVANSTGYQNCLLQHDLRSNEDVIRHLRRDHMKPPYCPICSQTFHSLSSRDYHILERTCELCDLQPIDGINLYQKSQLKKKGHLGKLEKWMHIYAIVFPSLDSPPSPYFEKGHGKTVSMARDYWAANRRCIVSKFLESHKLLIKDDDEEVAQEALCELVLKDVLNEIVKQPEDEQPEDDPQASQPSDSPT